MRFHTCSGLDMIAPHLGKQDWNEAEVLGSAVWLWMHSASHRNFPLHTLPALLLPAIRQRQFLLAYEGGRPVFYLAWANLSAAAEQRYISQHPLLMPESDWHSGERLWLLDWIAPFGHTPTMMRIVRQKLFAGRCVRYLAHHGNTRGLKVKTLHGRAILPHEARDWFAHHPVALAPVHAPLATNNNEAAGSAWPVTCTENPTGENA